MKNKNYASLSKRFTNGLIDGFIILYLWITIFILISHLSIALGFASETNGNLSFYWIFTIIPAIIAYYLFFEGIFKTTLGKIITKTKIIRSNGDSVEFVDVMIRTFCRLIPLEPFSFLSGNKIGFHDNLSKTRLVNIS
jgi:uncharacterized RDD family membrane protein YckC